MEGHWYLDDLVAIYSDHDVKRYISEPGRQYTRDDVAHIVDEENEAWKTGGLALMLLQDRTLDRIVGILKFQPSPIDDEDLEVVVAIHPEFRREGYAKESLKCVLDDVGVRGSTRIIARVSVANTGSRDLIESLGFRLVDERVDCWASAGTPAIEHIYERRHIAST